METQERMTLFGTKDPEWTDPRTLLLDKLLSGLPREEQIEQITTMLAQREIWDNVHEEQAIPLVEALGKLFENPVDFRAHLMEVYRAFPTQKDGDRYNERIEIAPNLKLAILGMIIQGWNLARPWQEKGRLQEDAEECFKFLCQAFTSAPQHYKGGEYPNRHVPKELGKIRKGILDFFREHLKKSCWRFYELDPWILSKETSEEIVFVFLKARTRLAGLEGGRREVAFLEPFDLPHRSEQAIALIQRHMAKTRRTEELAIRLTAQVACTNRRGDLNPDERFRYPGDVAWELKTESVARVKITFWRRGDSGAQKEKQERFPQIIRDIQMVRDELLEGIENPPTILIEAVGPDGSTILIEAVGPDGFS